MLVPVTVYCKECLDGEESIKLCTEFGDAMNTSSSCIYLYQNVDSLQGSSFVPQLATVMDEICENRNHSRPKVMEVSEDVAVASSRERVKRQVIREVRQKGTVGGVATF